RSNVAASVVDEFRDVLKVLIYPGKNATWVCRHSSCTLGNHVDLPDHRVPPRVVSFDELFATALGSAGSRARGHCATPPDCATWPSARRRTSSPCADSAPCAGYWLAARARRGSARHRDQRASETDPRRLAGPSG